MRQVTPFACIGLGLSVVLAACSGALSSEPPPLSEEVLPGDRQEGPGWYNLVMLDLTDNPTQGSIIPGGFGDEEATWVGRSVSTNWIPDFGTIYLGPDDVIEPLLSLQMQVLPYSEGDEDDGATPDPTSLLSVTRAVMTTSDVKVGTGPEINGRSYEGTGIITDLAIGRNYITGELELRMERLLFWPEDEPQSIGVKGTFLAVKK